MAKTSEAASSPEPGESLPNAPAKENAPSKETAFADCSPQPRAKNPAGLRRGKCQLGWPFPVVPLLHFSSAAKPSSQVPGGASVSYPNTSGACGLSIKHHPPKATIFSLLSNPAGEEQYRRSGTGQPQLLQSSTPPQSGPSLYPCLLVGRKTE